MVLSEHRVRCDAVQALSINALIHESAHDLMRVVPVSLFRSGSCRGLSIREKTGTQGLAGPSISLS